MLKTKQEYEAAIKRLDFLKQASGQTHTYLSPKQIKEVKRLEIDIDNFEKNELNG